MSEKSKIPTPFSSSFVKQLSQAFQVDVKLTPAFHPQSNGLVERFMATLRRLITTYIEQQHINNNWDSRLRIFRFVYNTTYHSAIKNTPFFVVHGREARLPLLSGNIIKPPSSSHSSYHDNNTDDYVDQLNDILNVAHNVVFEQHKDDRPPSQQNPYSVNDQVLLFNTQLSITKLHRHRKLMFDWNGPYKISEITSLSTVSLKDLNSNKSFKNVHISRIKPFIS